MISVCSLPNIYKKTYKEQDEEAANERESSEEDKGPEANVSHHCGRNLSNNEVVHLDQYVRHTSRHEREKLTQFDDAEMETPFPRMLRGQISAASTHAHGPQLYPKPAMKSQP